jgi:hypothetical protein
MILKGKLKFVNPSYQSCVKGKSAEEILEQHRTSDSHLSEYLQTAAQIRSNQELIAALAKASNDSGKAAGKIALLTWALVFAAILQAVAQGWPYISSYIGTKFNLHPFLVGR